MKRSLWFLALTFAVVASALSLIGCSAFQKSGPSGLTPTISTFTFAPASGKAPLSGAFTIKTANAERCEIVGVGDVPCNGSKDWTVTASTTFILFAYHAKSGETAKQAAVVTITP